MAELPRFIALRHEEEADARFRAEAASRARDYVRTVAIRRAAKAYERKVATILATGTAIIMAAMLLAY